MNNNTTFYTNCIKILFLFICIYVLQSCIRYPLCIQHPCVDVPGNTKATPAMQTEAATSLFDSAKAYVKKCSSFKVIDTQYIGPAKYNWWEEKWIIDACGRRFEDIVSFRSKNENVPDSMARGIWLEEVK